MADYYFHIAVCFADYYCKLFQNSIKQQGDYGWANMLCPS